MTWRELSGSRIATRRTIKSTTIENPGMLYVGNFPCLACRHAWKMQMWTVKHGFFSFSSHVRLFLLLDLQTTGVCTACGHGQRWPPRAGWGFTRQCSDRGQGWGFAQGKR